MNHKTNVNNIFSITSQESVYQYFVTIPRVKDVMLAATNETDAIAECNLRFGKFSATNMYSIWKKWVGYKQ